MRTVRASLLGLAFVIGALAPAAVAPGIACAGEGPHAALVVDTGSDQLNLCVRLDADEVSGLRLIELAGAEYDLDYRFDGGAVCRLAETGTAAGEPCFAEYPYFWGFWIGDESGGWTWAGSGAASMEVSDGDVHGWAWGTGDDGSNHPAPSAVTFESICGYPPGAHEGTDDPGPTSSRGGGPGPSTARDGGPETDAEPDRPRSEDPQPRVARERAKPPGARRPLPSPTMSPRATPLVPPDASQRGDVEAVQRASDRPAATTTGILLALLATVVLVGGAAYLLLRRDVRR